MADLKSTVLHDLHVELGAKMVPFAGYTMPVQYPMGVMKEHLHCRQAAGLFDVSHMGQVKIRPKSGNIADAAMVLETLVPVNILAVAEGRQRYAMFTSQDGGILDDLMVANHGDHLFLVVNAACKDADFSHMIKYLSSTCDLEMIHGRSLIALQGPASEQALSSLNPAASTMKFMDSTSMELAGVECWVSRSGYTGEDGYEISVPDDQTVELCRALLEMDGVAPIGLGARDSLRLEAGLCLYGNDIDASTSPVEAGIEWAIQKARRTGGDRAGGFRGADRILAEMDNGADRRRVGILPDGRAPMREGTVLFAQLEGGEQIGHVTSGAFGPSIGGPMSMGYVTIDQATVGTEIFGEVRGKRQPARVAQMPFKPANFKR